MERKLQLRSNIDPCELRKVAIVGTGAAVPERVLTNREFEQMVDTTAEWILTRTGIQERRIVAPDQSTSDLGAEAMRLALERTKIAPEEIDLVVCATMTPDHLIPSTAAIIARAVGATRAGSFDLGAACSGFVFGLSVGRQFIATGAADTVVVVGAEAMSRVLDYTDRATCIIFGDGAGACILRPSRTASDILRTTMCTQGDFAISIPAGGARLPATHRTVEERQHFVRMKGRETFKFAVTVIREMIRDTLQSQNLTADDITLVIPHQVNLRIIEAAIQKVDIPMAKVLVNIDRYGNTSGASIGIALDEAVQTGRLERGDLVLLLAFGAGLAWGSALIRW